MKRYYFSLQKYTENRFKCGKPVLDWAKECDGKEVRDEKVVGTPYVCDKSFVDCWCICRDDGCYDKIVITTDGKETLARIYRGGKVIKTSNAVCSPDDTFDFQTGAKMAFQRLMDEKPEPKKFKAGDKVRIRQWDDMRKEYGVDYAGSIECVYSFISSMKPLCGEVFTISRIEGHRVFFKENNKWLYSTDMIEPVGAEEPTYYNGKVVCVKSPYSWFTVGKIYEVKDGIITTDTGSKYPKLGEPYKDFGEIRHAGNYLNGRTNPQNEFIELKE